MSFLIIPEEQFQMLLREVKGIKEKLEAQGKKSEEVWLTSKEVIDRFKISPKTLQNYRDHKVIRFVQRGAVIRYKLSDLEADFSRYKVGERIK